MRLEGKIAVITGSSRGIGRATALTFAREGAKVVVNCRANVSEGEEVVSAIKNSGGQAILVQADVSVPQEIKAMFERTVGEFGGLDVLVNNAGIDRPKPFFELTVSDWDETMKTNLYGPFLCAQEAARIMLERGGGKILNTCSVRSLYHAGRQGNIAYSASKAALYNFTTTLAKELAPTIKVNGIAPGPANTDISAVWDEETRNKALEDSYLRRLVEPQDIANAFLFLASSEADAITGELLVVDGGYNLL